MLIFIRCPHRTDLNADAAFGTDVLIYRHYILNHAIAMTGQRSIHPPQPTHLVVSIFAINKSFL